MFRLVVICGCLMAMAQAGRLYEASTSSLVDGLLVTQPRALLTLRQPVIASTVASSSNIIRGIDPLTSTVLLGGRNLIIGQQKGILTNAAGLGQGLAINDVYATAGHIAGEPLVGLT